ncbi:MAG TPA: hypothetical protein VK165_00190 [Azonexus sp.]|nr:hypothetical protein [Azonexus sp.]
MKDEIEHRPKLRRGATEPACRHWTPIALPLPDEKATGKELRKDRLRTAQPPVKETPD